VKFHSFSYQSLNLSKTRLENLQIIQNNSLRRILLAKEAIKILKNPVLLGNNFLLECASLIGS